MYACAFVRAVCVPPPSLCVHVSCMLHRHMCVCCVYVCVCVCILFCVCVLCTYSL